MKEKTTSAPERLSDVALQSPRFAASSAMLISAIGSDDKGAIILGGLSLLILGFVMMPGNFTGEPNQQSSSNSFGHYIGTVIESGRRWANPLLLEEEGLPPSP
jgi:hypothetical protein